MVKASVFHAAGVKGFFFCAKNFLQLHCRSLESLICRKQTFCGSYCIIKIVDERPLGQAATQGKMNELWDVFIILIATGSLNKSLLHRA